MSLASILSQFWLKDINQLSDKGQTSLKDWIKTKRFAVVSSIDEQFFEIIDYKPEKKSNPSAIGSFGSDINRFSSAAFESIDFGGADHTFKKSLSWNFIRSYYAAFFGAHALLRIFGESVSSLDRDTLSKIEEMAELYGMRPTVISDPTKLVSLKKGMYLISIVDNGTHHSLKGKLLDSKRNGGSHELMWAQFNNLLSNLQLKLLSGSASGVTSDLISSSDSITSIRASINNAGHNNGNWLSNVRNNINYSHNFDVWYPFGKPDSYYEKLSKNCLFDWHNELKFSKSSPANPDLQGFAETCGKIISLCKDSIDLIHSRSCARSGFLRKYSYSYLMAVREKTQPNILD